MKFKVGDKVKPKRTWFEEGYNKSFNLENNITITTVGTIARINYTAPWVKIGGYYGPWDEITLELVKTRSHLLTDIFKDDFKIGKKRKARDGIRKISSRKSKSQKQIPLNDVFWH